MSVRLASEFRPVSALLPGYRLLKVPIRGVTIQFGDLFH
jgi:hypothetical protein